MDPRNWFAKVKYQNAVVEEVPIKKIKTAEGEPFQPKHCEDFNPKILYSVETVKYDTENEAQRHYAFIGRVAETQDGLKCNRKRIRWPPYWPTNEDPNNTSLEDAEIQKCSSSILFHRRKAVSKKVNKRVAAEKISRFFSANDICAVALGDGESTSTNLFKAPCDRERELEEKVTRLEEELKKLKRQKVLTVHDFSEMLDEREEKMVNIIKRAVEETVREVLDSRFSQLGDLIKSQPTSSPGIATGFERIPAISEFSEMEEMVHLGAGYMCNKEGYNCIMAAQSEREWATVLIVAVFGEEVAKTLRVYPRMKGNRKFPLTFISLAKDLYRMRLEEEGFTGDIEQKIKQLPSYLSDRAYDLTGSRGSGSLSRMEINSNDSIKEPHLKSLESNQRKKCVEVSAALTEDAEHDRDFRSKGGSSNNSRSGEETVEDMKLTFIELKE